MLTQSKPSEQNMAKRTEMDAKERSLVERAHATLASGSFTERDVLVLLMLLRRHAAPKSPVREFADFVAHRDKDRGILKDFLRGIQLALHADQSGSNRPVTFQVLTNRDIHSVFNAVFASLGLNPIDEELANRIAVCIIALLQSVRIETYQQQPVRGLSVEVSSDSIGLFGHSTIPAGHVLRFPVLLAENRGYELSVAMASKPVPFLSCDHVIEACCLNGQFIIAQRPDRV